MVHADCTENDVWSKIQSFFCIGMFSQRNEAWNIGLLFISNKFWCSNSFFQVYREIVSSCGMIAKANILFSVVSATSRTLSVFIDALIFVAKLLPFLMPYDKERAAASEGSNPAMRRIQTVPEGHTASPSNNMWANSSRLVCRLPGKNRGRSWAIPRFHNHGTAFVTMTFGDGPNTCCLDMTWCAFSLCRFHIARVTVRDQVLMAYHALRRTQYIHKHATHTASFNCSKM